MSAKYFAPFVITALLLAGCRSEEKNIQHALQSITIEEFKEHVSVIASDKFMGRAPGTAGEELTIRYLADAFSSIGLEPANGDSYFQELSLVEINADPSMQMVINGGSGQINPAYREEFIGTTSQINENIAIDHSEIIFVGYGIHAPEYDWDDYAGLDVEGKTVLMLVNDPGYATGDTALFNGKAMTYYGRWTYKYEEAARQGATAAIIIHETGAASYPWDVVKNSWSGPQFHLANNEISTSPLQFQGWVTTDLAQRLFASAGLDYDRQIAGAARTGFKPVEMNLKASVNFSNTIKQIRSNNVAALWPGDERSDEYVIYMAHWDHLGVNNSFEGDSIFNGAVDNATGISALLQIARAFTELPERQARSVLFLAVTAEEQGLLGSQYYAENPLYPLNTTVAAINMDALNIFGKTKDMTIIGYGNSEVDDYALAVLESRGRYAAPDPHPERGGFFRSDHFSFVKVGVPSLYLTSGSDYIGHDKAWGEEVSQQWIVEKYHKPGDEYEPETWNFEGVLEDMQVYFEVGYKLSNTADFPGWSAGSAFSR
jgi:Zn-dependent M28 family amino/carboxypeptidase